MQSSIAAALRHLKQALVHLDEARLAIRPADPSGAEAVGSLIDRLQNEIKCLDGGSDLWRRK
ncbi:hypothetical protein Rvan_2453 [Rhodomicrobium vannielii ATCC 17100]|uniref:Uncharacterized protein n=1 Tax=Rhodomicrobium vannielii (strain ATCC 17100 / DSM 162 / LMG 4299 / NCIMB 10020 / ATH 3.1.1) TaxID=648757 RepID=E3I5F0_RHOVT|nr:hypothetical protein [Rhodomicrobium vannielii]ADP71671.1 hypothetical protein Rvan_2453 [Rhodomicrobium vannielii ATCC 17100]